MRFKRLRCDSMIQTGWKCRFVRCFSTKNGSKFILPKSYQVNKIFSKTLPFKKCIKIWWNSLSANRLATIQNELIDLMVPESLENTGVMKVAKQVVTDQNGNYINEVGFKVINGENLPTKHLVFIHGYGASLGCFARNFQIINQFKTSTKFNYHVHFLDNITFGLSSNPKLENKAVSWKIPPCAEIKLFDNEDPDKPKRLYKKYYKLIDGYQLCPENFARYQSYFKPILEDMESFYCTAIDQWREASKIPQIDFLIGHSFGAYWCGSYALRNPNKIRNLILLSPVGLERHVMAITNDDKITNAIEKPNLDPTTYKFLSRLPILSQSHILQWYYKIPYLPRFLPYLGPFGVKMYFKMWLPKLAKINKLIVKHGGAEEIFTSGNDLVYGSKKEIELIVEYLYNSISNGSHSDIYVRYLLTPATVSKWPLYDKFVTAFDFNPERFKFNFYLFYGEYDFMNSEAGEKLIAKLKTRQSQQHFVYDEIAEGGHNLYIDNPFDTNRKIYEIAMKEETRD
ncbi:hypothetical protein KGF56_001637 [Candida oxycetoniae]|uniref:AB hydrolase-1 domain-containing protein n=1 Tax=Candida oxycetoniae TaxID=497107 RepID=A0AAI9WZ26_9ASCO|nr:uncharacterized protein KGF56_001637 [Candida oxycetoniae]KAI3405619.2 hypothetical protein KGF56_001637 [Candida oxycetoniae]